MPKKFAMGSRVPWVAIRFSGGPVRQDKGVRQGYPSDRYDECEQADEGDTATHR